MKKSMSKATKNINKNNIKSKSTAAEIEVNEIIGFIKNYDQPSKGIDLENFSDVEVNNIINSYENYGHFNYEEIDLEALSRVESRIDDIKSVLQVVDYMIKCENLYYTEIRKNFVERKNIERGYKRLISKLKNIS